ncbi:pre-tRNA nuclear export protein [Boothiomyces sp. JEL0866]|nr:pre-tRNA nuclear export protein [Boothiomyces sp. JEL0866]
MVSDLEKAITIALDPTARGPVKDQAIQYCNHIKQSNNGWEICAKLADETIDPQVKFFCFQAIEEHLRNYPGNAEIRKLLWKWLSENISSNYPYYLRNKLYVLIVLLFRNQYPHQWPTFFDELFMLIDDPKGLLPFLQILITIDEEVVCLLINRSQDDLSRNTLIKDTMRESVVPRLLETWLSILTTVYQSNTEISAACLKLFGLYVSWVDINLILHPKFISILFESFRVEKLRIPACECLSNMILKGMKSSDKLKMIQMLNVFNILSTLTFNEDQAFDEQVAKFINNVGLELCHSYDDPSSSDQDKYTAIQCLAVLFSYLLKYISSEQEEITSALFPFLGSYLLLLKRLKRLNIEGIPQESLAALLHSLVSKLKYDPEVEYRIKEESGEEEAVFTEMRKAIKVYTESVAAIDEELYTKCISESVLQVFDSAINSKLTTGFANLNWYDIEGAMYLLYIFVEAKVGKGPPIFIDTTGGYTPIGLLISKLLESGLSSFPHPSIPTIYFEIIFRYCQFFEQRQNYLPEVLQSFLDARGLFHPVKSIRLRVNYLFLRFVKLLRQFLGQYVESILSALTELLVIKQRILPFANDPSVSNDFDSQIYLFEAVGYLISIDSIAPQRQGELLTLVMIPLLQKVEEIMRHSETTPLNDIYIAELADLISAIGGISKGFPEFEKTKEIANYNPEIWRGPFNNTIQGILVVLRKFNTYPQIREASRFALQRMTGCMGPELLEFIPAFLSSGLLSSETALEIIDFLPFIGLTIYKFQQSVEVILKGVWKPLREKISYFLLQPPVGTDDALNLLNLRKADLTLITTLFNSQLNEVLTCPENISELNSTLSTILACFDSYSDLPAQKLAVSLLTKMIYCWGGLGNTINEQPEEKKKGANLKVRDPLKRDPLPGFDAFIYEQIIPTSFSIPMKSGFNLNDGQSVVLLGELSQLFKTALQVLGVQFLEYLSTTFFPSIACNPTLSNQFITALEQLDKKNFKKYLHTFYTQPASQT